MFIGVFTFLGTLSQGHLLSASIGLLMLAQYPALTFYKGYKDGSGGEP